MPGPGFVEESADGVDRSGEDDERVDHAHASRSADRQFRGTLVVPLERRATLSDTKELYLRE